MKKLIKILGIVIAAVFALLVAAVIAITVFFNPNDYKGDIANYVKEKTGREFQIQGNISLSFFPWIGLEVGKTELGNPPGFGKQPFAQINELGLKVKLLPLLSKRVVMDTVILKGLNLHLIRAPDGRANWENLGGAGKPKAKGGTQGAAPAAGGGPTVDISGVQVSGSQVVWDDRQNKTQISLDNVNLKTGQLGAGKPVDFDLSFDVKDRPDARPRRVALSSRLALDMAKQTLDVSKLKLQFAGVELQGQVHGTDITTAPRFSGMIKIPEFVPRRLMQELEINMPETNDATVFGKASLDTQFSASTQSAKLSNLVLKLDDTTVKGDVGVNNFSAPAINYKLAVNDIDVDRYLPPPSKQPAVAKTKAAATPGATAAGLPIDALRKLNLNGTITIDKLKAYNIRSEDIRITTVAQHGNLRIHPATAKLYGGTYSGDVRVDARGREPLLSIDEKLKGVQAGPLLKDAAGSDWVTGTADLTAQLSAKGQAPEQVRRTLNGVVTFAFLNGEIKGVNIPLMIRKANAALRGEPAPPDEPEKTDFASLTGTAQVRNGLVSNRDLDLKSPLIRVTGNGTANLVNEKVDYLVKAVLVASLKGQGGSSLDKLKGVPIPIRVSGTFQNLSYRPDLKEAFKGIQKEKIKEEKQRVEKKVKEKLQDKLKNLFGK